MRTAKDILKAKGQNIWSVSPDDSVLKALEVMAEKNVGALMVLDEENLVGVISERDYARKIILKGRASKDTAVREIMTAEVVSVQPDTIIEVCMELMTSKRIRHLPVLEGDRLIGVVSIGDVVNAVVFEQRYVIEQLRAFHDYEWPW